MRSWYGVCIVSSKSDLSSIRFNIKMSSYQYRKCHCGDKTVVKSSYLHNGISYTGKTTSLYWIRALDHCFAVCQATIWTSAGILLIGPLGTNFSEILIKINTFWLKKIHLKMTSVKWQPFCLRLNVLTSKCRRCSTFSGVILYIMSSWYFLKMHNNRMVLYCAIWLGWTETIVRGDQELFVNYYEEKLDLSPWHPIS